MEERDQGRRIFRTRGLAMRLYGLDGPLQPEMSYAPLSTMRRPAAAPT